MYVCVFHNWLDLQTKQCGCDIETRGGSMEGFHTFIQLITFSFLRRFESFLDGDRNYGGETENTGKKSTSSLKMCVLGY